MTDHPKILVVDDDEAALLALSDALRLRLHEVEVDTATSCESALEQLRACNHDLVISDVVMPGADGLKLLTEVQRLRAETPVIVVTGHAGHEEAALYAGAYAFLDKPFNMTRLISIVRSALERSHLNRRVRERNQTSLDNLRMALLPSGAQPV